LRISNQLATAALALLILTAGCAPASLTNTPTPTSPAATPLPVQKAVAVRLGEASSASYAPQVDFGSTGQVRLVLEPVLLAVTLGPDGTVASTSTQAWQDAPPLDMEVCFGLDQPCALNDRDWKPLQAETIVPYPVDWLGPRPVYAGVQVRDGNKQMVPVFLDSDYSALPQVVARLMLSGVINQQTPAAGQPAPVQTALAATQAAYPISGSVLIEDGACCKGGTAGATIDLRVAFSASSSTGGVTEMRVSTEARCLKDASALQAGWEPFAAVKTYPVQLAINWVGWFVNVQYRDAQGNLSPVYCDDISLEGGPQ
jgi:hypothetical protein